MTYTVSTYLLDRLAECGVSHLLGVPGDFNLRFLDDVIDHPKVSWVGNANELNAGYAADGYARVNGLGAVLTTFGVGELSALNALAGAYAEYAPVLHVVGAPTRQVQESGKAIHHTLGDGDFTAFRQVAEKVSSAVVEVQPATAAHDIDRVLAEIALRKRPGYLLLADDVAVLPCMPPSEPLKLPSPASVPGEKERFRQDFTELLQRVGERANLTLLADVLVQRMGLQAEIRELVDETALPYSTLKWGKGLFDETASGWRGIYTGEVSEAATRQAVEEADVLICAGVVLTDTITAGFTHAFPEHTVYLEPQQVVMGDTIYAPLTLADSLSVVLGALCDAGWQGPEGEGNSEDAAESGLIGSCSSDLDAADLRAPLTQNRLWQIVAPRIPQGATVVVDQGTSFAGIAPHPLPSDARCISQPLWGSIGYSLPALLGAQLAAPESRGVLLIGDGSAQLTVQELGTLLRLGLTPIIVLVNNEGYTVEREIHGPTQPYNDIQLYNWSLVPAALGAKKEQVLTLQAATGADLCEALERAVKTTDRMVLLEVLVDRHDVPDLLEERVEAQK